MKLQLNGKIKFIKSKYEKTEFVKIKKAELRKICPLTLINSCIQITIIWVFILLGKNRSLSAVL